MEAPKVKFAKCACCGVKFENFIFHEKKALPKYCRSCQVKSKKNRAKNRKEYSPTRYTKHCINCEKRFRGTKNQKYCSVECSKFAKHFTSNQKLRFAILYRDSFRCQYCGATRKTGLNWK